MQSCRCELHVRIRWKATVTTIQPPGCTHALKGKCPDHPSPFLTWHMIPFISNWPFASVKEIFTCQSCKCLESCSPALRKRTRWPDVWMPEASLRLQPQLVPQHHLAHMYLSRPQHSDRVNAQGHDWISTSSPVYDRSVRSQRIEAEPFLNKRP